MDNCFPWNHRKKEAQHVRGCLNSETFYCGINLEEYLKAPDRHHIFDSISSGIQKWTKDGFLEFLENEKFEKEKLRSIVVQNRDISIITIEKYLKELDSNLKDIKDQIEKISQVSEKEEGLLVNPWIFELDSDTEKTENMLSNSFDNNFMLFYRLGQLKNKRLAILNKAKNDAETEQDFRKTCALYENNVSNFLLSQAYKEYVKNYQQLSSLYTILRSENEIKLFIYDTENQREEVKILKKDPELAPDINQSSEYANVSIIQLPNNELFIYKNNISYSDHGYFAYIINMLNRSYQVRDLPRCRDFNCLDTAIYFNRNIYCFGYYSDQDLEAIHSSWRFNLNENRWIELAPIENDDNWICCSIIFNGNIILSEYKRNVFVYSIDINSYSTIPYKFANFGYKILINGEERLYLIECGKQSWIYESEVGNEYNWQKISLSKIHDEPRRFYTSYNKGEIYISLHFDQYFREYFKFDLSQKKFIEIACYGDNLALESVDGNFETIKCGDQSFSLDSYYNIMGKNPFYIALRLYEIRELSYYDYMNERIGDKFCELGRNIEAVDRYNKAIKNNPDYVWPYIKKGKILRSLGRNFEAIMVYNKSLKILKDDTSWIYLSKGKVLCDLGRNIKGIKCFNKSIKRRSTNNDAYLAKGDALRELGKNIEAIECYNEALKVDADNECNCILIGDALCGLGRNIEALEFYNKAIEINPRYEGVYWKKWWILCNMGQNLEAIVCENEAISFEPNYSMAYLKKGKFLHELGRYIEAIECYNEAIKFHSDSIVYYHKGHALLNLKRFIEAIECYNEVIKFEPKDSYAYGLKGDILYELGQNIEALECYSEAIKVEPNSAWVYWKKQFILHDLGQNLEAIECYNEAISLEPSYRKYYWQKGKALHEVGRNIEALKYYNKEIKIKPNDAQVYIEKGEVLHDLGRNLEAIECYNVSIKIDPTNQMAYGLKGEALRDLNKNIEALEYYNKAIKLDPDYDWAYDQKAEILEELGRKIEALECYNKSITLNPNCSNAFCYRAALFNDLGQEKEAAKDFNTAYDIDYIYNNEALAHECLELLKILPTLMEIAEKVKEEFQKIKDLCQNNIIILNEVEEKESIIKEQRSQLIKRAVKCYIEDDNKLIEERRQMKIEVAEHQKAMIDAVDNLWELVDSLS